MHYRNCSAKLSSVHRCTCALHRCTCALHRCTLAPVHSKIAPVRCRSALVRCKSAPVHLNRVTHLGSNTVHIAISEAGDDQKSLFSSVSRLLHRKTGSCFIQFVALTVSLRTTLLIILRQRSTISGKSSKPLNRCLRITAVLIWRQEEIVNSKNLQ